MDGVVPHVDVITQLQDHVNALCAKLYNFLGALQRDAPPVSIKGEGLLASTQGTSDVETQTDLMANELLESFKVLEHLIQRLPPTDRSEGEQVQEVAALQEANAQAAAGLGQELAAAEARLTQLQDAFHVLADLELAARQRQAQQQQQQQGPGVRGGPSSGQ